MTLLLVDYGVGNLHSVGRALEVVGADVLVSSRPDELRTAERIVLPGVGGFGDGMRSLEDRGWVEPLREAILTDGIPCLGICLGMQLLATRGFEGEARAGLGVIAGDVVRLEPPTHEERVPHVGWNEVVKTRDEILFDGIPDGTDFYFVHSYHLRLQEPNDGIAETAYCGRFTSAVRRGNVFGVQFHPEKSLRAGLRLLRNFVSYSANNGRDGARGPER